MSNSAGQLPEAGLTAAQVAEFNANGFLVIPDALSKAEVSTLLEEAQRLLNDFSLDEHPMTKFSTGDGDGDDKDHVGDSYFLESGDKVRFFFEEAAFSPETGRLSVPAPQAINKVGHSLHTLNPAFRATTQRGGRNSAIARSLGFRSPRVLQSMVICKRGDGLGAAVPAHQDSTFLYTDPPSAVGFWYALEPAHARNGGLAFARASHRSVGVARRFVRTNAAAGTPVGVEFVTDFPGARFPAGEEGAKPADDAALNNKEHDGLVFEHVDVDAGALVLIHGNVVHKSERNDAPGSRFAYTFHIIEGEHEYDERNWLQPATGGFSKFD